MKRHDTHNVSLSEDGHSYIFSSQTPSEYSKTTNENKLIINKNKQNSDLKNLKKLNHILLEEGENEKNKNIKDNEIIENKNELEKGINNQENEKNVNNIKNKKLNIGEEKIEDSKKDNKDKKTIEKSIENNSDKKSSNSCFIKEKDDEEMNHIKELSLKKMRSFEGNRHPELENEKNIKNIINSQPNLKNKKKSHKNRLPKIMRCYFTKKDQIILITRNIYKEFFANLKNIEVASSEFVTNIRNENTENENISNKEEEENNNNNININSKSEEEKNYINNNCEEAKININIHNSNSNTIEGNYDITKDENSNIKNTDNIEDEDSKIISKIKKKLNKKSRDSKEFSNSRESQSKSKIKIYKREENNNKNSNNKSFKIDNKDNLKESYNQIIPSNIKRVINSNSKFFNEEKKKDSKEVRILKFNKNKSLIKNNEIGNKINIINKNSKNQNKKALSINNTPKNILILKKNESNKTFKIKTMNDNDKKYQNKTTNIKAEKNYIISNNSNNKINKKEEEKRKILILEPKNSKQKAGNKNEKRNQLYPKNNGSINQKTFPISLEKNSINIANKLLMKKKINKNNKTIEEIKNNEKIKNKQKIIKKNNITKSKEKEKDLLTNKLNYTNRETTIINNKNGNEIKILSHRSFHNAKNLTKYKFPQIIINKNKKTFENNSNPTNLKLDLSNSEKRNKEKILLSKKSRFNALQNYMKVKRNKKNKIINIIFKESEKSKRNNITGVNINNKINNDNTIFKTIEKPAIYHIKRIKKESCNILSLAQFQIKENMKNNREINNKKKYIKKFNNFHINRVKSSYFDKKTLPNFKDFETRINIFKNKRSNNSIFVYTRHYGDHNKCPMCQSMEMKAEFSKSKLGLYLKHFKNDCEESKLCSNHSSIRNHNFISSAKNIKNSKDSRNITFNIKKELSPININSTNDRYFPHFREQFVFNILKNKGKIDKLEINDFPVFNKYFNS